jgi:hypothetical protein
VHGLLLPFSNIYLAYLLNGMFIIFSHVPPPTTPSFLATFNAYKLNRILVFAASMYLIFTQMPNNKLITFAGFAVADLIVYLIAPTVYLSAIKSLSPFISF